MQDRFKFRCYHKPTKTMYEVFELNKNFVKATPNYVVTSIRTFKTEDCILIQCTDLKDKNGELIYENDIVFNNCGRWIIKYCDKCKSFQCFENNYGCYNCLGDYSWADFIEDLNNTIVEGNIYENKELLEDGEYE